jgi:hypothetical protein
VNQPAHAGRLARRRHRACEVHVRIPERGRTGFVEDSDEIDDRGRRAHESLQHIRAPDVGGDEVDGRQHLQGPGLVDPTRRHHDAEAARDELLDDMASDEPGAAQDEDRIVHPRILQGSRSGIARHRGRRGDAAPRGGTMPSLVLSGT